MDLGRQSNEAGRDASFNSTSQTKRNEEGAAPAQIFVFNFRIEIKYHPLSRVWFRCSNLLSISEPIMRRER